ncbi:class II glutamine amidotransferase [Cumulibacter manganitolerans]|uniref:class II glutamine amidotransferase n=1 Tax=Cumulibacter manganitolerans TaxID=1884992 RepID=UPI001295EFD1|nr:class II glutamine amidotransferase [Cumulibacter manganitolerans]
MCRLFGLTAGRTRVAATFWLLGAPDSLRAQGHANPDGTGLGTFDERGRPQVEKEPIAAYVDASFATAARKRHSATFVAHVRRSTGTPVCTENTHPFTLDGRIFAHNGSVGDLPRLEAHLGADLARVRGDTDSERVLALITRQIAATGDVHDGIVSAVGWIVDNLPVRSLNFVLIEQHDLWALRLPETNELWMLDRRDGDEPLDHRSSLGTRVHSDHLDGTASVVIASEPLDEGRWRLLEAGELMHVDPDLRINRTAIRRDHPAAPASPREEVR